MAQSVAESDSFETALGCKSRPSLHHSVHAYMQLLRYLTNSLSISITLSVIIVLLMLHWAAALCGFQHCLSSSGGRGALDFQLVILLDVQNDKDMHPMKDAENIDC